MASQGELEAQQAVTRSSFWSARPVDDLNTASSWAKVTCSSDSLREGYLELFSASSGRTADSHLPIQPATIPAWNASLAIAFTPETRSRIIACLNLVFSADRSNDIRVIRFVTAIVRQLRDNSQSSIQLIVRKLCEKEVLNSLGKDNEQLEPYIMCVFTCVGWATMLYKADPQADKPLAIDSQGAPCFSAPDLLKSFASRSVKEIVSNMGDVLLSPARRGSHTLPAQQSQSFDTLEVSKLNFDTLSKLAGIKIAWVDTVSAHLNFDMINLTLFLFRFPSFCQLHATRHSVIAGILDLGSTSDFTIKNSMEEILRSYSLIFQLNSRAQNLFRKEKANNRLTDPLLDRLCLESPVRLNNVSLGIFRSQKESFEASTEFPMLSQRFLRLQRYIDGIPTNRISSLWKDRRDMSRWYTFWAVILIGGAGLLIGVVQAALAAESVELAREQLKAQVAPTSG